MLSENHRQRDGPIKFKFGEDKGYIEGIIREDTLLYHYINGMVDYMVDEQFKGNSILDALMINTLMLEIRPCKESNWGRAGGECVNHE